MGGQAKLMGGAWVVWVIKFKDIGWLRFCFSILTSSPLVLLSPSFIILNLGMVHHANPLKPLHFSKLRKLSMQAHSHAKDESFSHTKHESKSFRQKENPFPPLKK